MFQDVPITHCIVCAKEKWSFLCHLCHNIYNGRFCSEECANIVRLEHSRICYPITSDLVYNSCNVVLHEAMRRHLFVHYQLESWKFNNTEALCQDKCMSTQLIILKGVIEHVLKYPDDNRNILLCESNFVIYGCSRLKVIGGDIKPLYSVIPTCLITQLQKIYKETSYTDYMYRELTY